LKGAAQPKPLVAKKKGTSKTAMQKVFQTVYGTEKGNCLTAVWASLLKLNIEEVPHFVVYDDYFGELCSFLLGHGLEYERYIVNPNRKDVSIDGYDVLRNPLPDYGSINGFFDATVYSPGHFDKDRFVNDREYTPICHAVICDKNLNIVHDPNPKYQGVEKYPLAEELGFNGILGVSLFTLLEKSFSPYMEPN
jgi:hypothetical protein